MFVKKYKFDVLKMIHPAVMKTRRMTMEKMMDKITFLSHKAIYDTTFSKRYYIKNDFSTKIIFILILKQIVRPHSFVSLTHIEPDSE